MKKRILMPFITAALLFTGCSGGGHGGSTDSGTVSDSDTRIPDINDGAAVGIVGKLSTKTDKNSVSVSTGDVSFGLSAGLAFGIRDGAGTVLLSKSGKTSVIDDNGKTVISSSWSRNGA